MSADEFVQIERRRKFSEEEFYPMVARMYEQIWLNLLPPQLVTEDLPTKIAKNIVTPVDAPVPECLTCGACCGAMICVAVSPTDDTPADYCWDITSGGEQGEITVDRYLRRSGETLACANLGGTIGESVGCKIYEQRPRMCHVFEAGSDKCHAIRRAYGIEPFLTIEEMMWALQKLKAKDAERVPAETIRDAKIAVKDGTEFSEIIVLLKDGTLQTLHVFDPKQETWRQYQFSGLTLAAAREMIVAKSGAADVI